MNRNDRKRTSGLVRLAESDQQNLHWTYEYENKPIQIYWKFYHQKMKIFRLKVWYFSYFCSKHRLWYSLEPPRRGGSNEYPQSMFFEQK